MNGAETILRVDGLARVFTRRRGMFAGRDSMHAVRDVSLRLHAGETLGIVGESGCGKSTLARMLVGLDSPTAGAISLYGATYGPERDLRGLARQVQYVFQDPVASLNPRKTVRDILEAPLRHLVGMPATARHARIGRLLDAVGLTRAHLDRYPHEFSGGQAQRIGIARALAADPKVLVLDEPVSALDVSIQAQVLELLAGLRREFGLSYVFISHDLSVIEAVSDRVAVMYFGSVVEQSPGQRIFTAPRHPYTALLQASAPTLERRAAPVGDGGELPDPFDPPAGCSFAARCPRADARCCGETPPLREVGGQDGHAAVACWHPLEG